MFYYFENDYDELFGKRIFVITGDITKKDEISALSEVDFNTVINCAASVKHFADIEFLKRVNVYGVKNLARLCLEKGARLIHISTVSVSGDTTDAYDPGRVFKENMCDIGQETETNAYVHTKFLSEKLIVKMISKGLDAKIMRVGNLMSRHTDGEFQMNFLTNNFMNTLRAYATLGCFPISELDEREEISPIDETARGIVLLSGTKSEFTVFHVYNSNTVEMGVVLDAMKECGINIEVVDDKVFEKRLGAAVADESINSSVAPLVNYRLDDEDIYHEIPDDNKFTIKALYRLGFRWAMTDMEYLDKLIVMLKTLGFFD